MSCPSWSCMFSLTVDFRVWCPQPSELMSAHPWRVRAISPVRQKLPPVAGPYGRLVWEVVTFCHLRNWLHSFECSFAQWAVRALSASGLFWFFLSFSNFLPPTPIPVQTVATDCAIPAFATRAQRCNKSTPSRPVQSPAGLGLCFLMLKIMKGKGEEKNEKWWARVRDLPLVLCGLFFLF